MIILLLRWVNFYEKWEKCFVFAVQIEKTEILNILHKEWEKAFFNV